jgi:hypothetical protein
VREFTHDSFLFHDSYHSRCILAGQKQDISRQTQKKSASEKGKAASGQKNEGEGNRTAAREYNDATRRFVQSGRVRESGERAKEAVEGGERGGLQRAEETGKSKMREEDPAVERKSQKE